MAISSITDPRDRAQIGKAISLPILTHTTSNSTTVAAGTSGSLSLQVLFNSIGTTAAGLSPIQGLETYNTGLTDS